jgi:CBS domain containing-hemolysin-like protein
LPSGGRVNDWLLLGLAAVLTIGTGLFVASEFALVSTDRSDLESRIERGERGLDSSLRAMRKTSTHLSAAQLGITLTTLLTGFVAEPPLSRMLNPLLGQFGLTETTVSALAVVLAMTIATLFSFLIGELVPKNMAIASPIRVLRGVVGFQAAFTFSFGPLVRFLNANGNALLRMLGVEPREELSGARSAQELASLVRRSASLGSLEVDTANLLAKAVAMSELAASDIMTPRPKVYSLEREATASDVVALARSTGHSRFPVVGEDGIDDIVGLVHIKKAVSVPVERRSLVPVTALMVEPIRVPETMALGNLIISLRGRSLQVAVVVDEYGGTAGIATLEDAVEELVGELADEHDRSAAGIKLFADGSLAFSGLTRPAELAELGLVIAEDEDYDTVSGFIMSELGRIPVTGDAVSVAGGELRVVKMDGRRVDKIRFIPEIEASDG